METRIKNEEIWEELKTRDDFIALPRYSNSLKRALERFPDGVPDQIASAALCMSLAEYNRFVNTAVKKLRNDF